MHEDLTVDAVVAARVRVFFKLTPQNLVVGCSRGKRFKAGQDLVGARLSCLGGCRGWCSTRRKLVQQNAGSSVRCRKTLL